VFIAGIEVDSSDITYISENTLHVVAPSLDDAGTASIRVENTGLVDGEEVTLRDVFLGALIYLEPLTEDVLSIDPTSSGGRLEGGHTITLDASTKCIAPGAKLEFVGPDVYFEGTLEGINADVNSLTKMTAMTPMPDFPGLVELWVVNPNGDRALAGIFSYDLPPDDLIDLPSFPPPSCCNI